jgi:phage tail protein X
MIGRAEVERAILDEESTLEQVARLLEIGAGLAEWPAAVRTALALALEDPSMSRPESWKAVALRRHLFGPAGLVPAQIAAPQEPSTVDRRRAERLRSGLPALVRYRVGTYLLPAG